MIFRYNIVSFRRVIGLPASLALLVLATASPSCGRDPYSELHSDSGIRGPAYSEIVTEMRNLEQQYPDLAKVIKYGQSGQGRELIMLRIAKAATASNRPAVYISGSTHGDEYLNIEDRLPRWLLENQNSPGISSFLAAGGILYIVPIYNPDGYENRRRENSSGEDLNRDFPHQALGQSNLNQTETQAFTNTLKQQLASDQAQLKIGFDYHCCLGGIIYPWSHTSQPLPQEDQQNHRTWADLINQGFSYKVGQVYEILGYLAQGTSGDYFYETYNALAFTIEGVQGQEAQRFPQHTAMWDRVLQKVAAESGSEGGSTTPTGLRLALNQDQGQGQISVMVSADQAASMSLCAGNVASCTAAGAQQFIRFQNGEQVGNRIIFRSNQIFNTAQTRDYTIIAYDQNQQIIATQGVRISPWTQGAFGQAQ